MTRRTKRLLIVLGLFALAVGVSGAVLFIAVSRAVAPRPATLPPLADGLPRAFRDADRAFSARIEKAFPIGSPEADLVRTLEAQGFTRPADGERRAVFEQHAFVCRLYWRVAWKADDDRRISQIEAHHDGICL